MIPKFEKFNISLGMDKYKPVILSEYSNLTIFTKDHPYVKFLANEAIKGSIPKKHIVNIFKESSGSQGPQGPSPEDKYDDHYKNINNFDFQDICQEIFDDFPGSVLIDTDNQDDIDTIDKTHNLYSSFKDIQIRYKLIIPVNGKVEYEEIYPYLEEFLDRCEDKGMYIDFISIDCGNRFELKSRRKSSFSGEVPDPSKHENFENIHTITLTITNKIAGRTDHIKVKKGLLQKFKDYINK